MSNELAIAAVTITMHNLLDGIQEIKNNTEIYNNLPADIKPQDEIKVTNLPLDVAFDKSNRDKNYVNLFLYRVEYSAAWRNRDIPGKVKQGETSHSPLALNLYYIITANGEKGNELIGHLLLGKAMSILHDHPVLGRNEIKNAFELSELHKQVERLRITPQPISLDEVSKLWAGFQTHYRLSAAYEVSVVLIESKHPARTPLPVLTIGPGNEGVRVQPNLVPPYPALEDVILPNKQTGAQLGDLLIFTGQQLEGSSINMRFKHSLFPEPEELPPGPGGTKTKINIVLPNQPDQWPAGIYTVEAAIVKSGRQQLTNKIPLAVVPRIITRNIVPAVPAGSYTATITFNPEVWPEQSAALLLGDREFPAQAHPAKTGSLTFQLTDVPNGSYFLRLRIDGVDSLLIDRSVTPPVFYPGQQVTIP